jgi:hypothetical protein
MGVRAYSDTPAEEPASADGAAKKEGEGEAEKIKGLEEKIKSLEVSGVFLAYIL